MNVPKRRAREERRRAQLKAKNRAEKRAATRTTQEAAEIAALKDAIAAGAPPPGSNPLAQEAAAPGGGYAGARAFDELPLSGATKAGLRAAGYTTLTAIQRAALPHALAGRDILGAAKTGSGKTLCFLIPLVERLFRASWVRLDGLGGLVLTPTRELALQIFEELVKVGKRHDLSAGLLIGGKAVSEEASRVNAMNILVATPGRLLQHMDETPGFDPANLQVLVLDEADRILDMGFAATLDAILANLPRQGRQTLLFSATQTKSVRDLARLSLSSPEYLAVHSDAAAPTPLKLTQAYMVVGGGQKLDVLWGFIKTHLAAKTIVFLSTCKQVRFVYEAFRKLRPGTPLRCLHGGMKQGKRLGVFESFNAPSRGGGGGVLFATDIAARGLDFPDVDWVVQADCPEDVAAYIHRVGRTARYTSSGRALLLLLPSERDGMLAQLAEARVPLTQLRHNPAKAPPISPSLAALLSKSAELKGFAQGALVAYVRSVFLQPNKAVFDAAALPLDDLAASSGLAAAPRLKFLRRAASGRVLSALQLGGGGGEAGGSDGGGSEGEQQDGSDDGGGEAAAAAAAAAEGRRSSGGGRKRRQPEPAAGDGGDSGSDGAGGDSGSDDDGGDSGSDGDGGDFLTIKQRDVFEVAPEPAPAAADADADADAAAAAAAAAAAGAKPKKRKRQRIKLGAVSGQRSVFDDDGNQLDPLELLAAQELGGQAGDRPASGDAADGLHVVADAPGERFERAAALMAARDRSDKQAAAALRRQARLERKLKRKAASQAEAGGAVATLGGGGSSSDEEPGGGRSSDSDSEPRAAGRRWQRSRGGAGSDSDGGGGSSDGEAPAAVPDPAYAGMARKSAGAAAAAGAAGQQQQRRPAQQQQQKQKQPMSIPEQEALALQLLSSQPW